MLKKGVMEREQYQAEQIISKLRKVNGDLDPCRLFIALLINSQNIDPPLSPFK
jgi:hypothetical protein